MLSDVRMGKWSDGVEVKHSTSGFKLECEITRSNVWPWTWVGVWTCCVRLASLRRDRKEAEWLFAEFSMWILKSPVMRNGCGVVAMVASCVWNSFRKVPNESV